MKRRMNVSSLLLYIQLLPALTHIFARAYVNILFKMITCHVDTTSLPGMAFIVTFASVTKCHIRPVSYLLPPSITLRFPHKKRFLIHRAQFSSSFKKLK